MKKVIVVANSVSGLLNFRGMLLNELRNSFAEGIIIIPESHNSNDTDSINEIKKMGYSVVETSMSRRGKNPFSELRLILKYFRTIKDNSADLVITYTIKPNIYAGLVSRYLGIPYVANITGLGTAFQVNNIFRKFIVILYRIALKKSKVVFFENKENQNIFINEKICKKQNTCLLAGAGVNLEHFSVLPFPISDVTNFLFMGRVMKEKGVEELFAAMSSLASDGLNVHLDVLGGLEESYLYEIEKYKNEGWLSYWGFQKDVKPFIEKCHCFVLPSWHEGMANTNLESASSGRPVITSKIPGCMEAVNDGVSGYLVEPKNVDSLCSALKKFYHLSQDDRIAMGLAGRRRMEELFDKKIVVRTTINEIQKIFKLEE